MNIKGRAPRTEGVGQARAEGVGQARDEGVGLERGEKLGKHPLQERNYKLRELLI